MKSASVTFQEDHFVYAIRGIYHLQPYASLLCLVCDKPYVRFYREKQKPFFLQVSLCCMERHLPTFFFRINRRTVINLKQPIKIMTKESGHWIRLPNELDFKISERQLGQLIDSLSGKITFIQDKSDIL